MASLKAERRAAAHDRRQISLLLPIAQELAEIPAAPEAGENGLDIDQALRRWTNNAIKDSPRNREEIASDVSRLSGREITKAMLDTWTGPARPNRLPADVIPALCLAVGNTLLLEQLAAACGLRLCDAREARLVRIGQWAVAEAAAKSQIGALAQGLTDQERVTHG